MVGARNPAGIFPFHPGAPHQNVLYGVVQHVAHVQNARNVRWGDDNGIRFATIWLATEHLVVHPILVPSGLNGLWFVFAC